MKIVALTGAGISQPSGIPTFRASDGLWAGHRIEDVAHPKGWKRDPSKVLNFYNARRVQLGTVRPNAAHLALAAWQQEHEVVIVTQNVDDLHERAGSRNVMHLHGRLTEAISTKDETWVKDIGYTPINLGDLCPLGGQLRPNIVWFGEQVPNIPFAEKEVASADVVLVIGTSLQVYPAAGLTEHARPDTLRILVDPNPGRVPKGFRTVTASAEIGVPSLASLFA